MLIKGRLSIRLLGLLLFLTLPLTGCFKPSADAEQQKQQGAGFLESNRQKPGVMVTPSGLQYEVLRAGQGATPGPRDHVTVNYRGSFIDGSEFDQGEGISFPLNGVIPGWTEGLQLMQQGASYRFFIPPELAYGETGAGRVIPPNATLIFEVDLIGVGE